ncbi:hypothetical protein [Streptomyces fumanus]|uniref:hypothetical protein n=1 Tax=Streptomyces fumanus TaxID=67302 RepID=UPI003402383C
MPRTEQHVPIPVAEPDHLTDTEWAGLTLPVLHGAAEGLERTGLTGRWSSDPGLTAVRAVRERLDELVAERQEGGMR